eukprot:scaffold4290_cov264-Prasinococcus_capsulatus_cf.AAC.1
MSTVLKPQSQTPRPRQQTPQHQYRCNSTWPHRPNRCALGQQQLAADSVPSLVFSTVRSSRLCTCPVCSGARMSVGFVAESKGNQLVGVASQQAAAASGEGRLSECSRIWGSECVVTIVHVSEIEVRKRHRDRIIPQLRAALCQERLIGHVPHLDRPISWVPCSTTAMWRCTLGAFRVVRVNGQLSKWVSTNQPGEGNESGSA